MGQFIERNDMENPVEAIYKEVEENTTPATYSCKYLVRAIVEAGVGTLILIGLGIIVFVILVLGIKGP